MPSSENGGQLAKSFGLLDVFALATGATLSAGLFLLPGPAVAQAGPALPLCYLLAMIPLIPAMMCKVELATAMPKAGGAYYFLDRSLGPLAGTVGGLGTWLALTLKTAFALLGLGAYLSIYYPDPSPVVTRGIAVGFALVFAVVNVFGAKKTAGFQRVLVGSLLLILLAFSIQGVPQVDLRAFDGFFDKGADNLIATAGMVYISYVGVTKVISVSEEIRSPERNLPLGVFLSMVVVVLVYVVTTTIMVGVLPQAEMALSLTPMADAAGVIGGEVGRGVVTVAAILAFFSVANAGILSSSRYPLAMARDNLIPSAYAKVGPRGTPVHSIALTVAIIIAAIVLLDPMKIAKLASAFQLLIFALQCLAVVVMRESGLDSYDPGYKAPWYPWLPLFGILAPFFLISAMGVMPTLFSLGLVAGGVGWYWTYARGKVDRRGALYHVFARLGEQRHEGLDVELRGILKEKGLRDADPFEHVVSEAVVIDLKDSLPFEVLIERAAAALHARTGAPTELFVQGFTDGTLTGATPVAKGVALPHMRLDDIEHPHLVLVRCQQELRIEAGNVFGKTSISDHVHAVVFLVSPESDPSQHLRMLAQMASRIDQDDFLDGWLGAQNDTQLRELFLRDERFFSLRLTRNTPATVLVGKYVLDLELPDDCLMVAIRRRGRTLVPKGSTRLELDDRLLVIGEPESIRALEMTYK